ncbi:multidrug effflux MFS transporter [Acidovorax sp. CCYZU-2555]|uniref:multidrug effflux MFS transporter n=1 Tax=Acidovorax sp. CCYZU-2555 TaxID=2835042 RepID=UPI001BCBB1BA|nr:multidrug effflux MFS transporter [Acidovorax sp. CCYZU-2555]MBS7778153.1 multidrug effflux MFS transporter [Acidovorax sp. CCYZU-2555]
MSQLKLTLLLAFFTMLGPLGIDTYLPSFHAIAQEFAVDATVVQQTLSVYVLGLAVMMLVYGTLSDAIGRRRVMLFTVTGFGLVSLLAALSPSIETLIALRAAQGVMAGAGMVVSRAMVQDRYHGAQAQRMMAMIMVVFGLAPALAPILGGWLQLHGGWRASFGFLALFALLLLATAWRGLPETLAQEQRTPLAWRPIARNYLTAIRHRPFRRMLLAIGLMGSGMAVYIASAAEFVITLLGQDETGFGWLFIPLVGGGMLGSVISTILASRLSPARQKQIGFALMGLACVVNVSYNLFFTASLPWAVLPIALYTLSWSLISPLVVLQAVGFFPTMRGLASSLQGFVQMMLFALITSALVPLLFHSALWLALGHAALIVSGMTLWAFCAREHHA